MCEFAKQGDVCELEDEAGSCRVYCFSTMKVPYSVYFSLLKCGGYLKICQGRRRYEFKILLYERSVCPQPTCLRLYSPCLSQFGNLSP